MMHKKGVYRSILAYILILATAFSFSVPAFTALGDGIYTFADQMMGDFLAVYLRDHMNRNGQPVGKSTWRWSDHTNTPNASGEKSRETDFWLSALVFDTFNDALEYSGDIKHKTTMDALYESFINANYHPTWDVHIWDNNTYNDDLCWWSQAFERTYRLTGDQKYIDTSVAMFDEIWSCWESASSPSTRYGGAPFGGITWRHNNATNWQTSGKNVCTNANAALIAARLAKTFKTIDAVKSADYANKAKQIYDWSYAHLYKGNGYVIDTVNSSGTESTAQFTYNYGMFAGAAYEMYDLFGDQIYLTTCQDILRYGWNSMTLSDKLTIKDEGQGDSAGFKMILLRQTANIVYQGGLVEFEKYLTANAVQAWKNRRLSDGLCGSNLAMKPKPDAGIASPCAILGPALLYWTGIDPTLDYGFDLIDLSDGAGGIYQAEAAYNEYINMDSSQSGYTGTGYTQYWDADGPHVQDGYVRFDVEVAEAGIYRLDFRWYTRGNNTRRLSINNGPLTILNFTRTAANRWEDVPYYAYFNKGLNTVKVIYYNKNTHPASDQDMDSWLFLDYLKVYYLEPYPAPQQTITLNGVNSIANYTDGWNGATNGLYVDYKVTVPKSGVYTLNFFYSNNGSAASRELIVNGYERKSLVAFPAVGPGWSHCSMVSVPDIALEAGENTVRLANNTAKATTQYINLLKYLGVTMQYSVACAEEMMEDFLEAYLRDHYDYEGNIVGLSTWRWSDNPDKGGGSTFEKRRETDFWLSAPLFDSFNDALACSKNPKYIELLDGLYTSFIESKWHPTWDVHDWMYNTYTDDVVWWCQAFERAYNLTGDIKYLDMSAWMWEEIMKNWDETVGYGGAPYGGFFWRRTAGDNVVNPTNATKNICSNLNSVIAATRLSKSYATIDPVKSAAFLEQAKKGFAWSRAHLLRESDYYVWDNISYSGSRSTGQHSYNYGNFAGAAYQLYSVTGEQDYLDIMLGVLRKAWNDFTQSDNLTVTGSEGTGDGSAFRMILIRQTASIVYDGGFTEFEKYINWNAQQAYNRRRMTDGLCGVNFAQAAPAANTDLASPNSMLGVVLAFYSHLDIDYDFGVTKAQLLAKIVEAKAFDPADYSEQSFATLQAEIDNAEAIYGNEYAPNRRFAAGVSKLNSAISGLRQINKPAPLALDGIHPVTFELENGAYTDSVSRATSIAGYSGTGYLTGFNTFKLAPKSNFKESVSFYVDATKAGSYDLPLRTAVYLKDEAFGKRTQTFNVSASDNWGHTRDVQDGENGSYWRAAGAVSVANPAWLQINLLKPTQINMVRIRIRYDQANRTQDFSLWGGLDQDNLVELKASQRYTFTRVTTSGRQQSGNYVDIEFPPTLVKYLRIVGTYSSTTGTSYFEVSEFEAYAPTRTAALYIDDVKVKDFEMPVNDQKLTGASWETGVIEWQDYVIKGVAIPAGLHKIAIVSEGNTPDKYTLDKITFPGADKSRLLAAIESAPADQNGYTNASWLALTTALETAIGVYEDNDATQEEIDAAIAALESAIAGLKTAVTEFFSSFETTESLQALSNNVVGSQNMSTAMSTAPGAGPNATADPVNGRSWDGSRVMRVTGTQPAGGNAWSTNLIYDNLDILVLPNTQFSYVMLPDYSSAASVAYSVANWDPEFTSHYICLDLEFDDGTRLSTLGGADQYGHPMTGRSQGGNGHLYMKQWNLVKCLVGDVAAGKTIKKIYVCYDKPVNKTAASHTFGAYIDYLKIKPIDLESKVEPVDFANIFVGNNDRPLYSRGNQWPCIMTPNGFNVWAPANNPHTNILAGTSNEKYFTPQPQAGITHITTTHQASTWLGDFGTFQFMPNTSQAPTVTTLLAATNRRSLYNDDTMIANPSYFSVQFSNAAGTPARGVKLELTPTEHAAMARMTFPADAANVNVIFDSWRATTGGSITFSGNTFNAVTAHNGAEGRSANMYIYGVFDVTPSNTRSYSTANATSMVTFPAGTTEVNLRLATSFISAAQAQRNLNLEIAATATFDDVRSATAKIWNDLLGTATIEGSEEEKVAFYSSVMRTYADPLLLSENTGTALAPVWQYASPYKGTSGTTRTATTGYKLYYNNGFWDTFRGAWATYQFLTPEHAGEMLNGLVQHYIDSNWLARWLAPGGRNSMVGTSSDIILGDAVAKGLSTFDFQNAYMASLKNASTFAPNATSANAPTSSYAGRAGMATAPYIGFTSSNENTKGLAWSIDNYLNDLGVSLLAAKQGYTDEAIYFRNTSQNFVNLWNYAAGGWFIGKTSAGAWEYPNGMTFNTTGNDSAYRKANPYEETNAFTTAFSGFADFHGLANLYGGKDKLAARLDRMFTDQTVYGGSRDMFVDFYDTKLGQYGHGNQPDYHIPYVYTYAGQPYKTQKYTRDICERVYAGASFHQLFPGDQDNGSTSGWYVMSALGFFPFSNGLDGYIITSPLFDKITFNLPSGKIEVICNNNSHDNVYIQSMTIDGIPYDRCFITTTDLLAAHEIVFEMGPAPSSWACDSEPPSLTPADSQEVPNPLRDFTTSGVTIGTAIPANDHTTEAAYATNITAANAAPLFNNTNAANAAFTATSASVYYYFPSARKVEMITLTSGTTLNTSAPNRFTLSGSNDGVNWTALSTRTGISFSWARQLKPFAIDNNESYNYYKLDLQASANITLSEVELMGYPDDIICILANGQNSYKVDTSSSVGSIWLRDANLNRLTTNVTVSAATVNPDGTKTFTISGTGAANAVYFTAANSAGYEITASRKTIKSGFFFEKRFGQAYAFYNNLSNQALDYNLIVAAYNGAGKMVGIDMVSNIAAMNSITAKLNIADFEGCTIKAFLWDGDFVPLCEPLELP